MWNCFRLLFHVNLDGNTHRFSKLHSINKICPPWGSARIIPAVGCYANWILLACFRVSATGAQSGPGGMHSHPHTGAGMPGQGQMPTPQQPPTPAQPSPAQPAHPPSQHAQVRDTICHQERTNKIGIVKQRISMTVESACCLLDLKDLNIGELICYQSVKKKLLQSINWSCISLKGLEILNMYSCNISTSSNFIWQQVLSASSEGNGLFSQQ